MSKFEVYVLFESSPNPALQISTFLIRCSLFKNRPLSIIKVLTQTCLLLSQTIFKMKKQILLLSLLLLTVLNSLFAQVNFTESRLPIVVITTPNGMTIPDEPKITADMRIIWNGNGQINRLTDPANHYNNKVGIEMRGSTSQALSDKKPYSIELRDATGKELEIPLFGMPKGDDWALIAPYSDKTLVRDALMYQLGGEMMAWAARTRFCEVVLNGNYRGVYVLTERIKRGKDRVNIAKLDSTMLSGDNLTGGYIVKIDKSTGNSSGFSTSWTSNFTNSSNKKTTYQYHYPEPSDIKSEQRGYIRSAVAEMETAFNSTQFADPSVGYAKFMDVGSLIDFILLNEISRNVDGYRLSTYLYKDRNSINSKFRMGPIWDFNIAVGNADYCAGNQTFGWAYQFNYVCPNDGFSIPFWFEKVMTDPNFKRQMRTRWRALRQNQLAIPRLNRVIDSMVTVIGDGSTRNFQQWNILTRYVWPNPYIGNTYPNEIANLKSWLQRRIEWMDGQIDIFPTSRDEIRDQALLYPNPSVNEFNFDFILRSNATVKLLIFNNLGQLVHQQETILPTGYQQIKWQPKGLSAGTYFYRLLENDAERMKGKLLKM
jgi:hypothetical protein